MIEMTMHPLGLLQPGRYRVTIDGRVLVEDTSEPLFAGARALQAEGVAAAERLCTRHAGSPHVSLTSTVGVAAKLTVREDRRRGPKIVPYEPYNGPIRVGTASPMRSGGGPVPDSPEAGKRSEAPPADAPTASGGDHAG